MNPKMEIEIKSFAKELFQTNNGLVKEEDLKNAKKCLLVDSLLDYYYLVGHRSHYPSNDKSNVELELDIILMTRSRFMELKETEANYLKLCN
jgi:hypothetical protein